MLIGGVVEHQFDDYADAAVMRDGKKLLEIVQRPVAGMNGRVIGDVVTVIAQGRREKRHQPNRIDAKFLQVIQPLCQTGEIANTVAIAIRE